eukprot:gene6822-8151_t
MDISPDQPFYESPELNLEIRTLETNSAPSWEQDHVIAPAMPTGKHTGNVEVPRLIRPELTKATPQASNSSSFDRKQAQRQVLQMLNGKAKISTNKIPTVLQSWPSRTHTTVSCLKKGAPAKTEWSGYVHNNNDEWKYGHMAMVSRVPKRGLWNWIIVWQATHTGIEGSPGQKLLAAFSDDARAWTKPIVIPIPPVSSAVHQETAVCSTCLKRKRGHLRYAPGGDIKVVMSADALKWTAPTTVYTQAADGGLPKIVANQLVVHKASGAWVLPYWQERPKTRSCHTDRSAPTAAGVIISKDQGKTWKVGSQRLTARGTRYLIEATLAEISGGRILQLWRSGGIRLWQSTSTDGGVTWAKPTPTGIPNPNTKVNMVRVDATNQIALAFNDVSGGPRRRLRVAVSDDSGASWKRVMDIDSSGVGLHFSYPTIAVQGCRLLVAYSLMRHGHRDKIPISKSGIKLHIATLPSTEGPPSAAGPPRAGAGLKGSERAPAEEDKLVGFSVIAQNDSSPEILARDAALVHALQDLEQDEVGDDEDGEDVDNEDDSSASSQLNSQVDSSFISPRNKTQVPIFSVGNTPDTKHIGREDAED